MIEHHTLAREDLSLHYAAVGTGPPIVFLHGFPEAWFAWRSQLAEFGSTHRAIAPDLRGYNRSDRPAEVKRYRIDELVGDLAALATTLAAAPFVLVAHDWGGAIAWQFAIDHPERVAKLVIINAPHPFIFARELATNPAQRRASEYMTLLRETKAERVLAADGFRRLARLSIDNWNAPDRADYLEAWSRPGAITGMLNYYRATPLYPGATIPALDAARFRVCVPTLVIWGEADSALLPANLDGLDSLVPELEIERIAAGSHWVIHEQPERVNALIRAFIET